MTQPLLYMIAGPNGAGKTTVALTLLPDFLSVHEFVNADEIARGLNPLNPYGQPVAAGKVMLQRIDDLINEKKSFAFESTGSSLIFAEKMRVAKSCGYRLGLLYLWLPSDKLAKERVRLRVAQGGHDVSAKDVERRFKRSLSNLVRLYLPLVDEAAIYNSGKAGTSTNDIIAEKVGSRLNVLLPDLWKEIERMAEKQHV